MSIEFTDQAVIYHSAEDGCWIAHSLRTDQLGTGADMTRALADLIRAIHQVLDVSAADETIAFLREAPAPIQALAKTSKPLPREIYEVAHKMVHGNWPADIEPGFRAPDDESFSVQNLQLAK